MIYIIIYVKYNFHWDLHHSIMLQHNYHDDLHYDIMIYVKK